MPFKPRPKGFATKAVQSGYRPHMCKYKSVVEPIITTTTFQKAYPDDHSDYVYAREANPTRSNLESALAVLENSKYGLTFSSGMAAVCAVMKLVASGGHVIIGHDVYGGTFEYMEEIVPHQGIQTTFVDSTDVTEVENALRPNTKLIFIESTTNPLLKVADIEAIGKLAHKSKGVLLAVDNTFLTPYFQHPLDIGADLVMYSLTKYMNGHSDIMMGSVLTNDKDIYKRLQFIQYASGIIPSPRDCHIVSRSLKTLPLRMEQHQKNAMEIAKYLETHPLVEKVLHPGLPSHPQHELALKLCYGHSGMLSFYIKGNYEQSKKFVEATQHFILAASLGGPESLISIPALASHAMMSEDVRLKMGISKNLIRLSVGLEDVEDLVADLQQALQAAQQ